MLKRLLLAVVVVCAFGAGALGAEALRPHVFSADGRFGVFFRRDSDVPIRDVVLQVYDPAEKRWVGDQFFILTDRDAPVGKVAGRAVFRAEAEGTYYLRTVAVSDAGLPEHGSDTDSHEACDMVAVYDKTPPAIELVEPVGGETYSPGAQVQVLWSAEDRTPLESGCVTVEFSSDGGVTWQEVAARCQATGTARWRLPEDSAGAYRVRVTAVDRAGNSASDESAEFRAIAAAEAVEAAQPEDVVEEAVQGEEQGPGEVVAAPDSGPIRPEPQKRGDRAGAVKVYRKGVVYLLRGDYDEAAELLEKAVELDPTFIAARVDLSVAYANDGRFRKARTLLERSTELFPKELAFRYNLGRLYYRENDYASALKHLGASLAIDPAHVESLWLVGDIHAKREELDSARHYWQEVIENAAPGNRWREKATLYLAASYGRAGARR